MRQKIKKIAKVVGETVVEITEKLIPPKKSEERTEENGWIKLNIDGVKYLTMTTKKFANRKIWVKKKTQEIRALISGKIKSVEPKGTRVKKRTPLLIIDWDYIGMYRYITYPTDVIIRKVFVAKGQHVKKGKLLLRIEFAK